MLEREFEILIRTLPRAFLPSGWVLIAQQLSLPSGRLDMLYSDKAGVRHVVELKKGKAPKSAIEQVLSYANDLRSQGKKACVVPWIIANEISKATENYAHENKVRTLEITTDKCFEVMRKNNITARDLFGKRLEKGVLHGGSGGVRKNLITDNNDVFKEVGNEIAKVLLSIDRKRGVEMFSGGMQTTVTYKGVKLGGYNRKHRGGHAYITDGVVINTKIEKNIEQLGFKRMVKSQKTRSHQHVWWELSAKNIDAFEDAIGLAIDIVDETLEG